MFNGLIAIDSYLAPVVASTSLSSERAVLIHQFDDGHGIVKPPPLYVCEVSRHTNSPGAAARAAHRILRAEVRNTAGEVTDAGNASALGPPTHRLACRPEATRSSPSATRRSSAATACKPTPDRRPARQRGQSGLDPPYRRASRQTVRTRPIARLKRRTAAVRSGPLASGAADARLAGSISTT